MGLVIGLSLVACKICMFLIECWKPAAIGYGHRAHFVLRQAWLSFFCHIDIVNRNHTTSGPGPSPHFPSCNITQPSGEKRC